jgi:hypothetical protein
MLEVHQFSASDPEEAGRGLWRRSPAGDSG